MEIQSYRLKRKRCKKDKNKSELFLFSPLMTPSSTFSQAKQKKSNTKTKTKVNVEGKKQKYFCLFQRLFQVSERLLIFVLHHWSMIEMHSQAEAYTLHYSTLSPLCPILFFLLYFLHCAPSFFTLSLFFTLPPFFFTSLRCVLLFLHCLLLLVHFTMRFCVCFFTLCPVFINRITNHRLQIL